MKQTDLGVSINYNTTGKMTNLKAYIGNGKYSNIRVDYDLKGKIVCFSSNGYDTLYKYDNHDRIVNIRYINWVTPKDHKTIREENYTYNDQGTLTSSHINDKEDDVETWNTFDINGNIIYDKSKDSDGSIHEVYYKYDEQNRCNYMKTVTDEFVKEVSYKYDNNGNKRIYKESTIYAE